MTEMNLASALKLFDVDVKVAQKDFERLAKIKFFEVHPDKNPSPSAHAKTQELNEAREVIRKAFRSGGLDTAVVVENPFDCARESNPNEGVFQPPFAPKRGEDCFTNASVSYLDANIGAKIKVNFNRDGVDVTATVKVPLGTTKSLKLRIRGGGCAGLNGAENGDLIIDLLVMPTN